mmetsp:Transcript_13966/g.30850  ORF Transcript_13966/g.30850 Transcript_13966/m.30850 type:complete len:133 (-) Transcript_13966:370-768(-)
MREIVEESKLSYILNRLSVEECCLETRSFSVGFDFNFRDREDANKLLRERPRYMRRFVSPHYRSLVQGEVEAVFKGIASDQAIARELRMRGEVAEGRANKVPTAMERLRLPMLYMKMLRGQFLGNKRAEIRK